MIINIQSLMRLSVPLIVVVMMVILANGIQGAIGLYQHFINQQVRSPKLLRSETKSRQQRITDYVANNPRHGCIPQPAFIDFDLAKHGEWIKLESFENLRNEYASQWGFLNFEGLVWIESIGAVQYTEKSLK